MAKNKIFLVVAVLAASVDPQPLYLGFDGAAAAGAFKDARDKAAEDPKSEVEQIRLISQDHGLQKQWKAHQAAPVENAAEVETKEKPVKPTKAKKEAKSASKDPAETGKGGDSAGGGSPVATD